MNVKTRHSGSPISTYALYSEAPSGSDPEFFHIEDIKSRARLFSWTINIHVHPRMFQLIYVRNGSVRVHIDGEEQQLTAPCVITVPQSVVHGFEFERDITVGYVVTVSQLLLMEERFQRSFPFHDEMMRGAQIITLQDQPRDVEFIEQVIGQLDEEYRNNRTGKQQMFEWLLFSLLIKLGRHVSANDEPQVEDRYEERYRHLCQLIEKHYREHRPNSFYAEQLRTTTIGLNRASQALAGKSLSELIHDRLILEAQRMLIYSSVPVSLIAYDLGFSDPAYFSRFFKRRVGAAPSAFRDHRDRS